MQRSERQEAATKSLTLWTILNSKSGRAWKKAAQAIDCEVLFLSCQQTKQGKIQLAIVEADGSVVLQVEAEPGEWPLLGSVVCGLLCYRWVIVWHLEDVENLLRQKGVKDEDMPEMESLQSLYSHTSRRKITRIDDALEIEAIHRDYTGPVAVIHAQQMAALVERMSMEYEVLTEARSYLKMRHFIGAGTGDGCVY